MAIRPIAYRLVELATRWELPDDHPLAPHGIDESMSIDQTMHCLFGASKVAADVLVQEYGRYFGMKTVCFRGGCLTGPGALRDAAARLSRLPHEMHGDRQSVCRVFGYNGKQVRDNIHSFDLVDAFWHFFHAPRSGEVYNIGGGRYCNCSMIEAIELCEKITGRPMRWTYSEDNRIGDHIWWISDIRRFQAHYPHWSMRYDLDAILKEIFEALTDRVSRLDRRDKIDEIGEKPMAYPPLGRIDFSLARSADGAPAIRSLRGCGRDLLLDRYCWLCNFTVFELPILTASAISFVTSTVANYLLCCALVFRRGRFSRGEELLRLFAIAVGGLSLNSVAVWLLAQILTIDPTLAKIIAVLPVIAWNYLGRRLIVFDSTPSAAMLILAEARAGEKF